MKLHFPIFDKNSIQSFIPQYPPMTMVDKLLDYTETTVTAGLTIDAENIFVQNETFSEAGLVEHMAQTIALHKGYFYYLNDKPAPVGYIGSIKNIAIKKLPKLHQNIETKAEVIQEFMGVTLVKLESFVEGEKIAFGEMKTILAK
ncbi:MAG: hypothetical protein Q3983_07785 [Capnocytophaga sp.]|nr:hypothetical protein [Capnocytophaga sp.]